MKPIKVSICTGTACYVMGASDLLLLSDELPENLKDKVEIEGKLCFEKCKSGSKDKPPFVSVNDEMISEANLQKVISKINEIAAKL